MLRIIRLERIEGARAAAIRLPTGSAWTAGSAASRSVASAAAALTTNRTRSHRVGLRSALPAALSGPGRAGSAARPWRLHRRNVHELPLVVVAAPVVKANRLLFALARHAHDAADWTARRGGATASADIRRLRARWRRLKRGPSVASGRARCTAAARLRVAGVLAGENRCEVVVRDRVFVLLAKESLGDEHVEVRRIGVCVLALEQPDGVRVLLAAENQLLFLLSLRGLLPHWQCNGEHHGHDAHRDEEHRHGVAGLSRGLTA